jgi:hypothetical protein
MKVSRQCQLVLLVKFEQKVRLCENSSSHGVEYEAQNPLGCTAMFSFLMSTNVSEMRAASIIRAP